jgi:hypothetical protein
VAGGVGWVIVTSPFCGIGQLTNGTLAVTILNVPVGWYYYFVVVY